MKFPRASGLLLHPTSLPGPYGIGDLGPEAFSFVDLLVESGQRYWQMLPLGPTGYGDSPYQSFSVFAGNTLLISPDLLIEEGLATAKDIKLSTGFPTGRVDYGAAYEWKASLFQKAFANFKESGTAELQKEFADFIDTNRWWLDDYALFRSIKASQDHRPWYEWPETLKLREAGAMAAIRDQLAEQFELERFRQFLFFRQCRQLKRYANEKGVMLIGDLPIFVALDSADVWCNRELFKLNADGRPRVIAGVPPDYFSATGQLWGNPIYDWDRLREQGFGWWVARAEFAFRLADIVRIDHFRGFAASWEVPGGDETAENGLWVNVPGRELFETLHRHFGRLPFIAEDLGHITEDVEQLRDHFGFPGMKILQYGFGGDAFNRDLPHNYVQNCVAFSGTHDNDTTVGWWRSLDKKDKNGPRAHCLKYLGTNGKDISWDLTRAVWASVADTAIVPVQDILSLDTGSRMNKPATQSGNWSWRLNDGELTKEIGERLRAMTELYGRTTPKPIEE